MGKQTCKTGKIGGASDGGCAMLSGSNDGSKVSPGDLCDALSALPEELELGGRESDGRDAVEDSNGRRNGACGADCCLDRERSLDVLGIRHPMCNNRRLQRNHCVPTRERSRNLGRVSKPVVHVERGGGKQDVCESVSL